MIDAVVAAFLTVLATASTGAAVNPGASVVGTVTLTAADGRTFPGEGARVMLACPAGAITRNEVSDEHGTFRFLNVPVDRCSLEADVQGFAAQKITVVTVADQVVATDLHLGIAPLRAGVHVKGTAPGSGPTRLRNRHWRLERSVKRCVRRVRQRGAGQS